MADINRKYFIKAGDQINAFTVRQRVRDAAVGAINIRRRWRVECCCGKMLTVPEYYLTRPNPKKSCGCLNKTIKTIHAQEYRIWHMMRVRCNDPRHVAFKHYGGRGIKITPLWDNDVDGFANFLSHVGTRPSPGHSIDRIDNDKGYEPGNVRWATAKEQRANQRPRSS